MSFYKIKTPILIKKLFRNWNWSFSRNEKTLYLTFDDGPTPEVTPWTLKTLKEFNAKATFFCIGKNIEEYPSIFQFIKDEGHAIGNHTYNHLNGWKTDIKAYLESTTKTEKYINTLINSKQQLLFRPPYGKLKLSQARKLRKIGYKIIMWDVLSADFDQKISKEKCLSNVVRNVENGSIIVFHDSLKAAEKLKYVLPQILSYYTKSGYRFEKITAN